MLWPTFILFIGIHTPRPHLLLKYMNVCDIPGILTLWDLLDIETNVKVFSALNFSSDWNKRFVESTVPRRCTYHMDIPPVWYIGNISRTGIIKRYGHKLSSWSQPSPWKQSDLWHLVYYTTLVSLYKILTHLWTFPPKSFCHEVPFSIIIFTFSKCNGTNTKCNNIPIMSSTIFTSSLIGIIISLFGMYAGRSEWITVYITCFRRLQLY